METKRRKRRKINHINDRACTSEMNALQQINTPKESEQEDAEPISAGGSHRRLFSAARLRSWEEVCSEFFRYTSVLNINVQENDAIQKERDIEESSQTAACASSALVKSEGCGLATPGPTLEQRLRARYAAGCAWPADSLVSAANFA